MLFYAILLLGAAAPAAVPPADTLVLTGTTSKSLKDFGSCFGALQEKQGRPFWFVPDDRGGRISNDGGAGISNPYQVRFVEGDKEGRVKLSVGARDGPDEKALTDGMKSCW